METDFTYARHSPAEGIIVEEIGGGEALSRKVRELLALQVWAEHAPDGQERIIGHFPSGAPFVYDSPLRISISHTPGMLVIASRHDPDVESESFNPDSAIGIDVEKADRKKVVDVRSRFLCRDELSKIPASDLEANIIAWTCKEALYKAALQKGADWIEDYRIMQLPTPLRQGMGRVNLNSGYTTDFRLITWRSGSFIITLAHT